MLPIGLLLFEAAAYVTFTVVHGLSGRRGADVRAATTWVAVAVARESSHRADSRSTRARSDECPGVRRSPAEWFREPPGDMSASGSPDPVNPPMQRRRQEREEVSRMVQTQIVRRPRRNGGPGEPLAELTVTAASDTSAATRVLAAIDAALAS